jgi:hemerythrin-like domain-containing protein
MTELLIPPAPPSEAAGPAPSFLLLLETHGGLDALFLRHQEALLTRDLFLARRLLEGYETELRAHMQFEEERLLPLYRRAGPIPGGGAALFIAEHRKMLQFLERFHQMLHEMHDSSPRLGREILALLDAQCQFKHLVEHHDLREQNILYPALDRVAAERERRDLLQEVAGSMVEEREREGGVR